MYICEKLDSLIEERREYAPILIDRKIGINGTRYVKSEHIVPETGHTMSEYYLILQLSYDARQGVAVKARRLLWVDGSHVSCSYDALIIM